MYKMIINFDELVKDVDIFMKIASLINPSWQKAIYDCDFLLVEAFEGRVRVVYRHVFLHP